MTSAELLMLSSIYELDKEFFVEDDYIKLLLQESRSDDCLEKALEACGNYRLRLNFPIEERYVMFLINVPYGYPKTSIDVSCQASFLSNNDVSEVRFAISDYLKKTCKNELCLSELIAYIPDLLTKYVDKSKSVVNREVAINSMCRFCRLWIYSHHIYSKTKRKNILAWASDLNLTGFSLPGKPGIICAEGLKENVDEFWGNIRALNWKKIQVKETENFLTNENNVQSHQKFSGFEELALNPHGQRNYHMDLGMLKQYLINHNCQNIFSLYFGVDGCQ